MARRASSNARYLMGWLVVLVAMLVPSASPVDAHTYTGTYTKRIAECAVAGKYACQSHYILAVDGGAYGPLWHVRHSHGCTSKVESGVKWWLSGFNIRNFDTRVWDAGHGGHSHTTQWCGWEHTTHEFYPNAYVAQGHNQFRIRTRTYHCIPSECYYIDDGLSVIWNV
jgi:hypothetical protein